MKRTFLKVLPFAAALLLATSCSKDENTSVNDEVIDNSQQIETVVKTFKTLTIKGKVNKSISKVTVNDNALAFEGNEEFTFGNESADVYGTITFSGTDGFYTATINYTDEQYLNGSFTASLGSNPATISAAYDNLAAAVKNAYYTIDFSITQKEGEYKLRSDNSSDIVVNLQSAFIKALAGNTEKLDGTPITVEAGKYYVVPVGKTMGETQNTTIAGKIYSLGSAVPEGYVDLGLTSGNLWAAENYSSNGNTTFSYALACELDGIPTQADFVELYNQCYWVWDATNKGYYVFKTHADEDKGRITNSKSDYSPSTSYSIDNDPYIFLPAAFIDNGYYGHFWSSSRFTISIYAYCLSFSSDAVGPDAFDGVGCGFSVRLVLRSN